MFMEQNLGPHMEQKWADLAGSWGRVASWGVGVGVGGVGTGGVQVGSAARGVLHRLLDRGVGCARA